MEHICFKCGKEVGPLNYHHTAFKSVKKNGISKNVIIFDRWACDECRIKYSAEFFAME